MDIVKLAINNARLTISVLGFLLLAGAMAYQSTPKEAEPDVPIPVMYVSLVYQGISPEDSERLLLRPMETKLKNLKGLKEMKSAAFQGGGYVLVEFQPSVDLATALQDTRSKVQDAKADLPQAAEEPTVNEVNISEFPVMVVTLSGNVPERVLTAAARELRDRIEEVPGVLEGTLQGARDDLVEVVIDPVKLSSYGLRLDQLIQGVAASNSLVAAGNIEGSQGKYAVKVPSLIETPEDIANLPVSPTPTAVVQAKDVATVRSTFADAETITRLNGKPAIAIEVKKRIGANLIDTLGKVKEVADGYVKAMPEGMQRHLHAGQVGLRQPAARRPAEPRHDRRDPGVHRHPLCAVRPRLAADRPGDPFILPDRHIAAGDDGLHDQHDRAVQPDPGGRHAGRRRHHRH